MTPVETALLFVGKPTLVLSQFCETLNKKTAAIGLQFVKAAADDPSQMVLFAPGVRIFIAARDKALPAESFTGALESPLSDPFRGILSDTLFRHTRHMMVTVVSTGAGGQMATPETRLDMMKVAHAATTILAEWHHPAAIHWRQSNQLLVGSQYLRLASDPKPWVLFANARIVPGDSQNAQGRLNGLRLDEARHLIGRPIVFHETTLPFEEVHASALSFLRHAVETGEPIPDGHTFGPEGGTMVEVRHIAPCHEIPHGQFLLTAIHVPTDAVDAAPAAWQGAADAADDPRDRTRSLAISYMMLVILPPIGLILLVLNALFGANAWRTGTIAAASVALAIIVSAWTFLNYVGQETAAFIDTAPVTSTVLDQ